VGAKTSANGAPDSIDKAHDSADKAPNTAVWNWVSAFVSTIIQQEHTVFG